MSQDNPTSIQFDLENDRLEDVLNRDNAITGLSHAAIEGDEVALYVLPEFDDDTHHDVAWVCRQFGYTKTRVER